MAVAASRIEQRIIITGTDSSADAVKRAQSSMRGLDDTVKSVSDSTKTLANASDESAQKVQQTTQRMGGAFSAIAGALGPTGAKIAEIGRSATALGSTANILPGPLGLTAAALVGVGAGAYLAVKGLKEAAAARELLNTPASTALRDQLNLDAEGARKVASALEDMQETGLKPSNQLLALVAKHAESLGKDGAEGVQKFVAAIQQGPAAVKEFEREFGKLSSRGIKSDEVTADLEGLSAKILGVAAQEKTMQEQALANLRQVQLLRQEEATQRDLAIQKEVAASETSSEFKRQLLKMDADRARKSADATQNEIVAIVAKTHALQESLKIQDDSVRIQETAARFEQLRDAQASALGSAEARRIATIQIALDRRRSIEDAITTVQGLRIGLIDQEVSKQIDLLRLQKLQIDAQVQADKEARRKEAQASAQAVRDAAGRTQKAKAELDGVVDERERRVQIEAERTRADAAVNASDAKAAVKREQLKANKAEYNTKLASLDRELNSDLEASANDNLQIMTDQAKKTADLRQSAYDARLDAEKSHTVTVAMMLRARGKEEDALLAERRQVEVDNLAEIQRLRREAQALEADTTSSATDKLLLQQSLNERVLAQREAHLQAVAALDLRERDQAKTQAQAMRDQISRASDTFGQAAQAVGGPLGKGLQAAASGASKVASSWKSMSESSGDAISAVGLVAASFITNERAKAAVLAISEAAAAAASFATYNIPAGVGHSAAAALYGAVAGGIIPSSGSASAPSGSSSPGSASFGSGSSSSSSDTSKVVHIHLYGQNVVGTPQQVGLQVKKVLASLAGSGA